MGEKHLFNLKFAAKELERCSKKSDKEEKAEKLKLKKAIEKGNHEVARIHAENAIRQKNQSLNYLRMSARVDATASRVQSAVTTKKVTKSMEGVVKGMSAAMKSMDLPGPAQQTVGQSTQASVEQDELSQRLAKLRQT